MEGDFPGWMGLIELEDGVAITSKDGDDDDEDYVVKLKDVVEDYGDDDVVGF